KKGTSGPRVWHRLIPCACVWCGKMFQPYRNKKRFCSRECGQANRIKAKNRLTTQPGAWCQTIFKPRQRTKKFCSKKCGFAYRAERTRQRHRQNRGGSDAVHVRTCPNCKKLFEADAYTSKIHCSVWCSKQKNRRTPKQCPVCALWFNKRNNTKHC